MANIGGAVKQALLIALWESVKDFPTTLEQDITNYIVTAAAAISSGTFITASSGNGYSMSQIAGIGGLSPTEIAAFGSELRQLRIDCNAALIAAGNASPTDEQVVEEMIFQLGPVTSMQCDHTQGGYP